MLNGNKIDDIREISKYGKAKGFLVAKRYKLPTFSNFYLDYVTNKELIIDYVGKGWDGSYLSHGSACHETYRIPWDDVLFLNDTNRMRYRQKVVGTYEYEELRTARINEMSKKGIAREVAESSIPSEYKGISNEYFRQIINQVIIPMYDSKELQRYYKEYIPIVQFENGKVVVPEVILPERLRYKGMSGNHGER